MCVVDMCGPCVPGEDALQRGLDPRELSLVVSPDLVPQPGILQTVRGQHSLATDELRLHKKVVHYEGNVLYTLEMYRVSQCVPR